MKDILCQKTPFENTISTIKIKHHFSTNQSDNQ